MSIQIVIMLLTEQILKMRCTRYVVISFNRINNILLSLDVLHSTFLHPRIVFNVVQRLIVQYLVIRVIIRKYIFLCMYTCGQSYLCVHIHIHKESVKQIQLFYYERDIYFDKWLFTPVDLFYLLNHSIRYKIFHWILVHLFNSSGYK